MTKIAVLITDLFEDSEYTKPAEAFREAGYEVVHVGLKEGVTVRGKKEETPVTIDRSFKNVSVDDFDAILIPGGYSPDKLRIDEDAVRFTREFVQSDKPVFSICHGPQLLITARVLEGRRVAAWKSIIQDVINAGAEFVDQEVVEDRNIVSSRSPSDIPAFIMACLNKIKAHAKGYSQAA